MYSFKNCNILLGKKIINTSISFESKICNYVDSKEIVIPNDAIVLPGFIDKHTHGANNADCMYPTVESLEKICIAKASEGVTSFLATTMTASISDTQKAIKNIVDFIKNNKYGKMIIGIHLEGPFLCGNYKGAQPESHLIRGTLENFNKMVKKNQIKYIKQITLAPEVCDDELLSYLKEKKIRMSIGHSNASHELVQKSINLGLTGITHTYNAQSPLHHREVGVVGSALLEESLYPEIIVDLVHVCPNAIKILYKCNKNICLVTDSMEASHLEDGNYELGGQKVILKNNEARLENNTLAGSVLKMNDACRNIKKVLNVSNEEVSNLATKNPYKFIYGKNFKLNVGSIANFTVVDIDFNVIMTIVQGEIVYTKNS